MRFANYFATFVLVKKESEMKKLNLTFVIVPSLIFLTTLFLIMLDVFQKDPTNSLSTKNIIIYVINILFWISGAYLINKFSMIFFWSNLLKQPSKNAIAKILYRVFAIFIYTLALYLIMFGVLTFIVHETYWYLVLITFFVGGVLFYDKITDIFGTNRLNFQGSYNLGDWVDLINFKSGVKVTGKVLDYNRKEIILQTPDKGVAFIPSDVKNESIVINYDSLDEKNEFKIYINVDPEIPVEQVKRVLSACEKEYFFNKPLDKHKNATVVINNITEKGIEYALTFYIKPFKDAVPSVVKDAIFSNIITRFDDLGINLKNGTFEYKKYMGYNKVKLIEERLKKIDLFSTLNVVELEKLAKSTNSKKYNDGEYLIKQGDMGDSMFVLAEGLLSANVEEQGKDVLLGLLYPGSFFGEMSLLTGEARSATIKAESESIVYEIGKESIQQIIKERPEILNEIAEVVAERQKTNLLKLAELHNKKENLTTFVLNKIKDFLHIH